MIESCSTRIRKFSRQGAMSQSDTPRRVIRSESEGFRKDFSCGRNDNFSPLSVFAGDIQRFGCGFAALGFFAVRVYLLVISALSAQKGILLPKFLAGLEQSLRRRSCFADQSDLSKKLSDLFVVARADGGIGPAWVADIDAEMFHRGFHHRRQSIGGPFPGKQSVTARPETRCFEIPGAKGPDDLRADAGAGRGHGCARAAEHERH